MNKSIQQEDWILVNIYLPNKGTHEYIKQILTDTKGEIDSNTIIVGDFTSMEISSRQKINKESLALNTLFNPLSFRDLYRAFYPKAAECTFFSSMDRTFSR